MTWLVSSRHRVPLAISRPGTALAQAVTYMFDASHTWLLRHTEGREPADALSLRFRQANSIAYSTREGVLVQIVPGYPSMRSGPATLRTRGGTPHDGSKQGTLRASRRRRQGANPPAPGRRGTQRCGRSQARG